jgi:uncharacterized membrane protein
MAFIASCFFATLATDIAYWRTADIVWADFSDWLITVGVIVGYLALVVALIETFALRTPRPYRPAWPFALGMIVALILATFNMLVHTRDAWTSVVPWGLVLSAAVAVVLLVAGWTMHAIFDQADASTTFPALHTHRRSGTGRPIEFGGARCG